MKWRCFGVATALALGGCSDDSPTTDAGDTQEAGPDIPFDATLDIGRDTSPDVGVDMPIACYACESPGAALVCRPNQAAAGGCVFGDGRLGDLCSPTFSCAAGDCVSFMTDTIGFCSGSCTEDADCAAVGGVCRFDSDRPPDGVPDHCLWTCSTAVDCPP